MSAYKIYIQEIPKWLVLLLLILAPITVLAQVIDSDGDGILDSVECPNGTFPDTDGDGTPDFQGPSLEGQTFTYAQAGLYVARATLTDAEGRQSTVSAVVNVLERAQMDALLKAKWNAMKAALTRNDIEGALAFFTPPARDRFRALFALVGARIAQIAADMQDIELVYVLDGRAKYRLPRTQLYAGQLTTLTYYVYFVQDDAGLWSVESF